MMEASDYQEESEDIFSLDNDEDEAAAMDYINDTEPVTPYGSADPSAPAAAVHPGAASGRPHLSSAQAWQDSDQSSPPALSHSPSPPTTSAFQYRQQLPAQQQKPRHREQRPYASPHIRAQPPHHLPRQGRQGPGQGIGQEGNHLSRRISDLDLLDPGSDQQGDESANRRSRYLVRGGRHAPSDSNEHLRAHTPHRHSSDDRDHQHLRSGLRHDHPEPNLSSRHDSGQINREAYHQSLTYGAQSQHVHAASEDALEETGPVAPPDDQEYEIIAGDERLEVMYNGDEANLITAERLKAQVTDAVVQNGKVVYMVAKATGQWWSSPEMQMRKRVAVRGMANVTGQVLSGAGHVIMTNTPLGGFCNTVSTNVTAFKAAPFSYAMQGLGLTKSNTGATAKALPHPDQSEARGGAVEIYRPESGSQPIIADESSFLDDYDDLGGLDAMFSQ